MSPFKGWDNTNQGMDKLKSLLWLLTVITSKSSGSMTADILQHWEAHTLQLRRLKPKRDLPKGSVTFLSAATPFWQTHPSNNLALYIKILLAKLWSSSKQKAQSLDSFKTYHSCVQSRNEKLLFASGQTQLMQRLNKLCMLHFMPSRGWVGWHPAVCTTAGHWSGALSISQSIPPLPPSSLHLKTSCSAPHFLHISTFTFPVWVLLCSHRDPPDIKQAVSAIDALTYFTM